MTDVITIARLEFVSAARLKWIRLLTLAFALLAAAAAYSAGAATELAGPDGFARTTMTLVPVAMILIPLAAIVLGISGQSLETGSESFLFGQPIGRVAILTGRWSGQLAALGGAIAVGFGIGAAVVAAAAGVDGLGGFVAFVAASIALAAIFLSIAAAIAASTGTRAAALGIGVFAWFFCALLYDGIALSIAGWLTGSTGGRLLFASVFGNPADLVRVVILMASGTANVLGAAGEAWVRFLGGESAAMVAAASAVALWIGGPLAVAAAALHARDL